MVSIQVHDELVLEVDPSVIKEAALLLQTSMENAVSLLGIFLSLWIYCFTFDSLRTYVYGTVFNYFFSSSLASQIESWKIVGFFATFPGRSLTVHILWHSFFLLIGVGIIQLTTRVPF